VRLVAAWTKNYLHEHPVARDDDKTSEIADVTTRCNTAPMQWLPVIRRRPDGEGVLYAFRWGLLPSWAKDETIAARLINAETLADKPAFRSALRNRRCIVPTDGFYEWVRRPDGRQPFCIHASDSSLSSLAGLW
jgi:putative SOS response-associated peptidase YedK